MQPIVTMLLTLRYVSNTWKTDQYIGAFLKPMCMALQVGMFIHMRENANCGCDVVFPLLQGAP